jgi:tRNA 2-thiouridine synthesizing protein A
MNVTCDIDAKGLACPMPLLKAKLALNDLESGQAVKVHTTDQGSIKDFKTYTDISGHQLLSAIECDGVYTFVIVKTEQ